jgi:hypothetical protein
MRVTNAMIKRTAMELCILRTGDTMKVNGKMIKCMVSANFIMKIVKLPMKDTGTMMSSTGKEESTTQSLHHSRANSITKIFRNLEISGPTMKANSKATQSTVKVT